MTPRKKRLTRQNIKARLITESIKTAKSAGLRYVIDSAPGISRRRVGRGFRYIDAGGKLICDPDEIRRIKALAIPPAWNEVWICPNPEGHIQVTGRDARGRKQYRYHPRWRKERQTIKYNRMMSFGKALPLIRKRIERDLALAGLPRAKVLATIVRLLETTFIRVGNEEYSRANNSFGLTTMRDWHVRVSGSNLRFRFRGKSGNMRAVDLADSQLARIVKRCQDVPGYHLFQYIDEDGQYQKVYSTDVNSYLREITGQNFTTKDFRTWAGTVLAVLKLYEHSQLNSDNKAKKNVTQAIKTVAEELGNTPAVCRKYYVHPGVIDAYLRGSLSEVIQKQVKKSSWRFKPKEITVVPLLQQSLAN